MTIFADQPEQAPTPRQAFAQRRQLLMRPAWLGFGYLAFTVFLFQFGPMVYPTEGRIWVLFFLLAALGIMCAGYIHGTKHAIPSSNFKATYAVIIGGSLLSLVALWPSAEAYTGRSPLEVMDALANQSAVYSELGEQLKATEGTRTGVILLRILTQPFGYAAIPLSIILWHRGWVPKATFAVAAGTYLVFSILRGTDREVADVLVLVGAAVLVRLARRKARGLPAPALPLKKIGAVMLAIVAIIGALTAFSSRKEGRLGTISEFCMASSGACANYSNPLVAFLPDQQKFGATMTTTYLTNGYYGLQIALSKPWQSTFGLGHSSGLMRLYEAFSADKTLAPRTFNDRGAEDGWPASYFWSTMITSIANDVSFPGTLIFLFAFGMLWVRSWAHATVGFSDPAVVVFCLCMQTIFYFSANLQVLLTLDGYSTVVVWLVIWAMTSRRYTQSRSLRGRLFPSISEGGVAVGAREDSLGARSG
jgi:hypothetical protein